MFEETVCDSTVLSTVETPITDSSDEGVDLYRKIEGSVFGVYKDMETGNLPEVSGVASPKWSDCTTKT